MLAAHLDNIFLKCLVDSARLYRWDFSSRAVLSLSMFGQSIRHGMFGQSIRHQYAGRKLEMTCIFGLLDGYCIVGAGGTFFSFQHC